MINKKIDIILASNIENGSLDYSHSVEHFTNLESSLNQIKNNLSTFDSASSGSTTPRADWKDTPLVERNDENVVPSVSEAAETIQKFRPVLEELLSKNSRIESSATTNWTNIVDPQSPNHFAKLDLYNLFNKLEERENFVESIVKDKSRLYKYEYERINHRLESVLDKLEPVNYEHIYKKYVENTYKLASIVKDTRIPTVTLDFEIQDHIISQLKFIFNSLSQFDLSVLSSLLDYEWLLLLKLEPYMLSKMGVVIFFKIWTWVHLDGNFRILLEKALSTIKITKTKDQLYFLGGYSKFKFKGFIPSLALFSISILYNHSLNKNNYQLVNLQNNNGFEGTMGECFNFVKLNAGKLVWSMTNLSSYCFDQALRGWLDPKLILYNQIKDFLNHRR